MDVESCLHENEFGVLYTKEKLMHLKYDLTGQKFGKWLVLKRTKNAKYREPMWLCRCDCGREVPVYGKSLRHGDSTQCKKCYSNRQEDITGKKFGKWTVLYKLTKPDRNRSLRWWCKCECGYETSKVAVHLSSGVSKGCRKCAEKAFAIKPVSMRTLYLSAKSGAKDRGLKFQITEQDMMNLFLAQNKRCALTNRKLEIFSATKLHKRSETTASLDRIDSFKGYVKSNIQWVHKWVNIMKWKLPQGEFISLCKEVAQLHK